MATKRMTDKQIKTESDKWQRIINARLTDEEAARLEREMATLRAAKKVTS